MQGENSVSGGRHRTGKSLVTGVESSMSIFALRGPSPDCPSRSSSCPAKTDMDPHTMLAELGKREGPAAVGDGQDRSRHGLWEEGL